MRRHSDTRPCATQNSGRVLVSRADIFVPVLPTRKVTALTRNFAPSRTSPQNYRSKFPPDGASWWLPGPRKSWDEENRFAATAGFAVCSRSCRGPGRKLQLRQGHRFSQIQELQVGRHQERAEGRLRNYTANNHRD